MKKTIIISALVIANLILNIIILTQNSKIKKSVWNMKWDVSSIDSTLDYIDNDIKDIKEDIDDIKSNVDDIKYYLQ